MKNEDLDNFIDNHHVVYIRHLMDSNPEAYQGLISKRIAAIHYQGDMKKDADKTLLKNHENPGNYEERSRGRGAMDRLTYYCKVGAIVVADYSDPNYAGPGKNIHKTVCIGILPENTALKAVRYEPEPNDREEYPNGLIYKEVGLQNVIELGYADLALILAIHPRGSTVTHWKEGEKAIKFIYKRDLGLSIDPKFIGYEALVPTQQEVLCSEYLRLKASKEIRLNHLLLPVGRGMKAIDICGSNETKLIFAQVSFATDKNEIKGKLEDLIDLVGPSHSKKELVRVYFGPREAEAFVNQIAPEIIFVSLDGVFETMKDTSILNDMLGVELTQLPH